MPERKDWLLVVVRRRFPVFPALHLIPNRAADQSDDGIARDIGHLDYESLLERIGRKVGEPEGARNGFLVGELSKLFWIGSLHGIRGLLKFIRTSGS